MRKRLPVVLGTAAAVLVGLGVVFVVFVLVTSKEYRIPSSGMEPTLHCAQPGLGCDAKRSDRILVWKALYWLGGPSRGDIVAFHAPALAEQRCGPGEILVKRVVGVPGETFEERNGFVYLGGKKLDEPYVKQDRRDTRTIPPEEIARGRYFLMGDNRDQSCDSREWGPVTRKAIIGRVALRYWPIRRLGFP
jgi:signal peptidase I